MAKKDTEDNDAEDIIKQKRLFNHGGHREKNAGYFNWGNNRISY